MKEQNRETSARKKGVTVHINPAVLRDAPVTNESTTPPSTSADPSAQTAADSSSDVPVYEVGDIVRFKKPHPCGSFQWEILRTGMDFRLKCTGCGHMILVPRKQVEKSTKSIQKKSKEN